jgi:beta-1,4-mannosyltransferase
LTNKGDDISIARPGGKRGQLTVAIRPLQSRHNAFVNLFGACIADSHFRTVQFSWRQLMSYDVVIFHWPDEFFGRHSPRGLWKAALKLFLLRFARRARGVRVIWVAHNAQPHDVEHSVRSARRFVGALDGIVHLSQHSCEIVRRQYDPSPRVRQVITVHGHYRHDAATRPQPFVAPDREVRLVYFGQVRPYKGVEDLVACAAELKDAGLRLKIVGVVQNESAAARVTEMARRAPHIELDLRQQPLSEAELEAEVDAAHGVVLPYRQVLNSGAALYALSRNRPLLAPRQGSLPELQSSVGQQWVRLYDADLTSTVLRDYVDAVRRGPDGTTVDLSAFDWSGIGEKIKGLLRTLTAADEEHDASSRPV